MVVAAPSEPWAAAVVEADVELLCPRDSFVNSKTFECALVSLTSIARRGRVETSALASR